MAVISVRAIVAHCKLCFVPVTRGSHQWCQRPSDSSTILPCEGAFGLIPYDLDRVPLVLLLIAVEVTVNLVESRNTVDEGLCAEMS